MGNLLSSNFSRLWKDKLFWAGIAVMAGFQAFEMAMLYLDSVQFEIAYYADQVIYVYAAFAPVAMAVFCSMFLGTEYSDGTLRNKLVIGQRRSAIYLANLAVCFVAGVLFSLANLLVSLAVGIPLFGLQASAMEVASHVLVTLLMMLALAAVFTLVGMLCHSKAFTVAISILLVFGFLLSGFIVKQRLEAPETLSGYEMDSNGEFVEMEPQPNPKYLQGTKRKFYEFLDQFLPGGQMIANSRMMEDGGNDGMMAAYDIVWLAVTAGAGIWLFGRKDLK